MKRLALFLTLIIAGTMAFGQTVDITGTVNDDKGKPVPFAFVRDSQHPYATFADSTGTFNLKADPASKLVATALNYQQTEVPMSTAGPVKIVLTGNATGTAMVAPTKDVFGNEGKTAISLNGAAGGNITEVGDGQQNTHGSRYLFTKWVHGFGVGPDNTIIHRDSYLFNYNKMEGTVLFTTNGNVNSGAKEDIKAFTLFDDSATPFAFESVPAISAKHYVMVIGGGTKYKIYKDLGTRFIKANFSTNGISSSGNNYDEFADESVYYAVKLPDGQPVKLTLKKKALKAAFPAETEKVNKYLNDNDGEINDAYLAGLANVLNQ